MPAVLSVAAGTFAPLSKQGDPPRRTIESALDRPSWRRLHGVKQGPRDLVHRTAVEREEPQERDSLVVGEWTRQDIKRLNVEIDSLWARILYVGRHALEGEQTSNLRADCHRRSLPGSSSSSHALHASEPQCGSQRRSASDRRQCAPDISLPTRQPVVESWSGPAAWAVRRSIMGIGDAPSMASTRRSRGGPDSSTHAAYIARSNGTPTKIQEPSADHTGR